ncbi:hypothetical protein DVK06_12870 [Halorubrum sp. Atlit-28R]|nr:hypothetical protein DVK06_12870 [Halorubrum sp. Atlit-28R]
MKSTVLMLVSAIVALFLGFAVSFVVSPDPTGVLPLAVGVVLTVVLTPAIYLGIQRLLAPNKSLT